MRGTITKILRSSIRGKEKDLYWFVRGITGQGWSVIYDDQLHLLKVIYKDKKTVNHEKLKASKWSTNYIDVDVCLIGPPESIDVLFKSLSKIGWKFSFIRYNRYGKMEYELWRN